MRFHFLVQAFQLRKFLLSYRSEIYNYTEDGRSFMTIRLRFSFVKSSGSDRAALLSGCFLAQFFDRFAQV